MFVATCGGVPGYSIMYKSEHEATRRLFRGEKMYLLQLARGCEHNWCLTSHLISFTHPDCLVIWEALGSIHAGESIAGVAGRLCKFDSDDTSLPAELRAIDETTLPTTVSWAPWTPVTSRVQPDRAALDTDETVSTAGVALLPLQSLAVAPLP